MIADNWIQRRGEEPVFLDSQVEVYRGYFGPGKLPVLVKSSRPGIAIGELARSMEQQFRAAVAAGPGATPQPVYFGPYRDRIILATDDAAGKTLAQLLGTGPWSIQSSAALGLGLLKAVLVFHRAGWLHRTIRPDHIILDDTGRILLVGLGNARHMEDTGPDYFKLPRSGLDRAFLAPEQTGRLAIQPSWRTDIYAVGAVLYTLLAGRPPFASEDPVAILYDVIAGVPPAPGSFRGDPDTFMDAVVAMAMAKDPGRRYQIVTGFACDLELASASTGVQAEPGLHDSPKDCLLDILSPQSSRTRLSPGEMFAIMNGIFPGDPDQAGLLSGLALTATGGRSGDLDGFFSGLEAEGSIWFEAPRCRWRVSLPALDGKSLPLDIEAGLPGMLASLGETTLRFLECAACAGQEFDPDAVASIIRSRETRDELTIPAMDAGLIVPCDQTGRHYRFSHESIPRSLYNGLESIRKSAWHKAFAKRYEAAGRPDLALHHVMADPLKPHAREDAKKRALVFTQAGAARANDDPAGSLQLLQKAGQALGPAAWQEEPGLALEIALMCMSCAARVGDLDAFGRYRTEASRMAPASGLPRIEESAVQGLSAMGRPADALACALSALRQLGLKLPLNPGKPGAVLALASTLGVLRRKGASLVDLPDMTEPEARMALGIIAATGPSAYIAKPAIIPFLAAAGLRLCRRYGFHAQSAVLCAALGMAAISVFGRYRLGFHFGQLAERLSLRPSSIDAYARSRFVVVSFINHWFKSMDESLEAYLDAGRAGRSTGDHDYGSHAYSMYFQQAVIGGKDLASATTLLPEIREALASMNQELPNRIFRATTALLNSLKEPEDPAGKGLFDGRSFSDWQTDFARQGQYSMACNMALYRAIAGYLFFNFDEARLAINEQKAYASSMEGTFFGMSIRMLDCLLASREALAAADETGWGETFNRLPFSTIHRKRQTAWAGLRRMRSMLSPLARLNPVVYESRLVLVTALLYFHRGRMMKAFDTFEQAVSLARLTGSHLDEAVVCNEYAACLSSAGRQALAHFYQRAAYTALARWGATGAAEAMALRYPAIKAWVSAGLDAGQGSGLLTLDAEALLKASAVIAAERDGTVLLQSLLDVTMTTSGARFGAVWIPQDDGWIQAASSSYGTATQGTAVAGASNPGLPLAEIPTAKLGSCCEVQRTLVGGFLNGTGSVAFIPLLSRGKARGVLELGNEFVSGAFPPERMKIIEAIAAQASISIENAELYANLERKVVERTRDLEAALKNVRQLQGLIPICSSCKKVRDDTGYWGQVEEYISARTDADFTHGLCPECLEHYYDEMDIGKDDRRKESH
jgi:GAF domain-containing protein